MDNIDDVLGGYDMSQGSEYGSRPFIEPGLYRMLVQAVRAGRGGESKNRFVAFELKVLEAKKTEANEPNAVDTECVAVQSLDGRAGMVAPKNLKNYIGAITGIEGGKIDTNTLKAMCNDKGGAMPGGPAGFYKVEVLVQAFTGKKKDGSPITKLNWKPLQGKRLMDLVNQPKAA